MSTAPRIVLKPKREESLQRRHPWVFSGAIADIQGDPAPGTTVEVRDAGGRLCGRGAWSAAPKIAVRMWTFDPDESVDEEFLAGRIARALAGRAGMYDADGAVRLVYAESDGLPGLIVDRYAGCLVAQFLSAGAEAWKEPITRLLAEQTGCTTVYERSDTESRAWEGLPSAAGVLWGDAPPERITVCIDGLRFLVDVRHGHKTGFYLDQRTNRTAAGRYLKGRNVLDCFTYTGAFAATALRAGATGVTCVDASADALELARANIGLNANESSAVEYITGDVFSVLRGFRDRGRTFDAVILDPPKFAASRSAVKGACRGYKDINMMACRLLTPGGILVTFSCSQHIDPELFQRTVAFGALDAGRDVQVMEWLHQSPDHPVPLAFPEGLYLKGLIGRVL